MSKPKNQAAEVTHFIYLTKYIPYGDFFGNLCLKFGFHPNSAGAINQGQKTRDPQSWIVCFQQCFYAFPFKSSYCYNAQFPIMN